MDALFDDTFPVLPYNGTSGWSGSQTSRERAALHDNNGTTTERQQRALHLLKEAGHMGLTWKEASGLTGLHHGAISGVLSVLHKQGMVRRLKHTRLRCQVYVLPEYVHGREEAPFRPNAQVARMYELIMVIDGDLASGQYDLAKEHIQQFLSEWQDR